MALHLYPTIEFVPLPTTEPPTTTQSPTTTQLPTTTQAPTTTEAPTTEPPTTTQSPTTMQLLTTTQAPTTTEAPTTELPTTTQSQTAQSPMTDSVTTIVEQTTIMATAATTTPKMEDLTTKETFSTTMKATTVFVTDSPTTTESPTNQPLTTVMTDPATTEATTTQQPLTTTMMDPATTVKSDATTTQQSLTTTEGPATTTQSPANTEATTTMRLMTTTVAQTTTDEAITQIPTTEEMITTTAAESLPTTQSEPATTTPPAITTEAMTTSQAVATTTDSELPPDIDTTGTTEKQGTTTPSNTHTEDSQTTRAQDRATTAEEGDSTTALILENTSGGGGIGVGDLAAIVLGLLILIFIILVVAGIIAYKMKVCGGPRKKSSARYNVGNEEVLLQHNTLLRYTTRPRAPVPPLPFSGPPGPVHNIVPLYESVEEGHNDGLPYEVPTGTVIINEGSQVYYTPLGAGTAEYSAVLEQFVEGKELEEEEDPYYTPATKESELYAQLHKQGIKMIRDRDIEITGMLGEGHFGSVRKGMWRDQNGFILQAAIKTMKPGADEEDKVKFLQEAAIMAQFKHPNVVTLYGVVSTEGAIMIVVELLSKGDLKNYLDSLRPDPGQLLPSFTPRSLLAFCQQIALGMQYLASKGFVHRDLAARNILLSEGGICKIADFGMSRDLAEEDYYVSQGGKVPIKWTAPEALHFRKYSTASDVWSYGCLLYEIWSIGYKPFGAMENPEVIAKVDSGYRLPPPPGCPQTIYKTMIECWNPSPMERPGFRDILLSLLEDEQTVLSIPKDIGSNSLAAVLGAPLEAGFNMYTELQTMYYNREVTSSL